VRFSWPERVNSCPDGPGWWLTFVLSIFLQAPCAMRSSKYGASFLVGRIASAQPDQLNFRGASPSHPRMCWMRCLTKAPCTAPSPTRFKSDRAALNRPPRNCFG
jgi:hypothetical protein